MATPMSFLSAPRGRYGPILLFALFPALSSLAFAGVVDDARRTMATALEAQHQRIEALADGVGARMPVPAGAVDVVKESGVPNDGQTGAASAINRAIAQAAGRALWFPAGVYLLDDSIRPAGGTKLYFSPEAEMRRGFDGGNGDGKGALVQGAPSFAVGDVVIVGGRWTNPGNRYSGRVFTAIGRNWLIDSARVTSWAPVDAGSSCANLAGDDMTIRNCVFTGSVKRIHQDGIRVMCGTRIRITDCYVESGDDAFCAFPAEVDKVALSGRDLSDVVFERCAGFSGAARFLACGLTSAVSLQTRGAAISDLNKVRVSAIHFVDCTGMSMATREHAPAFFVVCANPNAGVKVEDITFTRCTGVSGPAAAQGALVTATEGARCAHVVLEKCEIFGGQKETVTLNRLCADVRIVDCKLDGVATTRRQ
jgi:hypothetical protein